MSGKRVTHARYTLRHERAAETRAAILRAAADIFAQAGLSGARTDAIARAAGVNKALLYYYFRSKDGLYSAVLEDHLQEFSRRALEVLATHNCARGTVLRYVSMHFDFISTRPYYPALFQRLMMTGGSHLERLVNKYFLPIGRQFMAVIERGVRRHEFRRVDPAHTAISLVGMTVFYFSSAPIVRALGRINPYHVAHLKRRKAEVLNFIRYGLFRNPEAVES